MDLEQKLSTYFSKDWSRERPEVRPVAAGRGAGRGPCARAALCRWRPLPRVPVPRGKAAGGLAAET